MFANSHSLCTSSAHASHLPPTDLHQRAIGVICGQAHTFGSDVSSVNALYFRHSFSSLPSVRDWFCTGYALLTRSFRQRILERPKASDWQRLLETLHEPAQVRQPTAYLGNPPRVRCKPRHVSVGDLELLTRKITQRKQRDPLPKQQVKIIHHRKPGTLDREELRQHFEPILDPLLAMSTSPHKYKWRTHREMQNDNKADTVSSTAARSRS